MAKSGQECVLLLLLTGCCDDFISSNLLSGITGLANGFTNVLEAVGEELDSFALDPVDDELRLEAPADGDDDP